MRNIRKRKRNSALAISAILIALTLAGCVGSTPQADPAAAPGSTDGSTPQADPNDPGGSGSQTDRTTQTAGETGDRPGLGNKSGTGKAGGADSSNQEISHDSDGTAPAGELVYAESTYIPVTALPVTESYYFDGEEGSRHLFCSFDNYEAGLYTGGCYIEPIDGYDALKKRLSEITGEREETRDFAREWLQGAMEAEGSPYDLSNLRSEDKTYFTRSDEHAVSFVVERTSDVLFPAVRTVRESYNINPQTGKDLTLEDILSNRSYFDELVREQAVMQSEDVAKRYEQEGYDPFESNEASWVLSYDGIRVFFQKYIINNAGTPVSFELRFRAYPQIFQEKYISRPASYIVNLLYEWEYETPAEHQYLYLYYEDAVTDENNMVVSEAAWEAAYGEAGASIRMDPPPYRRPDVWLAHSPEGDILYYEIPASDVSFWTGAARLLPDGAYEKEEALYLGFPEGMTPDAERLLLQENEVYSAMTVMTRGFYSFDLSFPGGLKKQESDIALLSGAKVYASEDASVDGYSMTDQKIHGVTLKKGTALWPFRAKFPDYIEMIDEAYNVYRIDIRLEDRNIFLPMWGENMLYTEFFPYRMDE